MSVVPGRIQVGETDEYLDTTKVTATDGTQVHREAVFIGDPETTAARAAVGLQGLHNQQGMVTHDPRLDDVIVCLNTMNAELQKITAQLNLITEFET